MVMLVSGFVGFFVLLGLWVTVPMTRKWLRYQEFQEPVTMRIDARRAAISSALGRKPRLRVAACTLWLQRKACKRSCAATAGRWKVKKQRSRFL
ncbi:MAG: hypothetical protein HYY96_09240 [Candidatus Tectomicrobia bacterium]|nr:hypothetical protein [Candidatus Tectomicrobia bacterium]